MAQNCCDFIHRNEYWMNKFKVSTDIKTDLITKLASIIKYSYTQK